ncbi:sulfite exporter TauE/SafE family protein [Neptunicella marina]|uniref:Probable membrane transporter protein n=1 Tax=Neptunicella marina TaxID=2125989 RepID=A0A8J6IT64_9ALTE|nr:sulfite exporter TauE/SafE family protein [Neptunicella marina]MBC3765360.1 sulfite exporter TauE/SafE family protein [Neptunicella marina]
MSFTLLWLGLCVFLGFTAQAMVGFGSMLIAVSLGSLFFSIPQLLPVLVPLNVMMTASMAIQLRHKTDFSLLLKQILPLMLVGMTAGISLINLMSGMWLKKIFAVLIITLALRELWQLSSHSQPRILNNMMRNFYILIAGIVHGLYTTGGPLLVYALQATNIDKTVFRATMVTVWSILNSVYLLILLWQGKVQTVWLEVLFYAPLLLFAIWLGNNLHNRVNQKQFKQLLCILLMGSGTALLVK